jgi:hypothetical protein
MRAGRRRSADSAAALIAIDLAAGLPEVVRALVVVEASPSPAGRRGVAC